MPPALDPGGSPGRRAPTSSARPLTLAEVIGQVVAEGRAGGCRRDLSADALIPAPGRPWRSRVRRRRAGSGRPAARARAAPLRPAPDRAAPLARRAQARSTTSPGPALVVADISQIVGWSAAAHPLQRGIHGDSVEPGGRTCLVAETAPARQAAERLLSTSSASRVHGDAEGNIVDAVGQLLDESLERATISRVQI